MEITHDLLIKIGFKPVHKCPNCYQYKGFRGILVPEIGLFSFEGLSHDIAYFADLKYLLMMIDFKEEPSLYYPVCDN